MKKIIFLSLLAIGMAGCSVESMDSTENLLTADAKYKVQEAVNPLGFYSGPNLKGTVSITNDCDNLYIEILPTSDDPDGVKLGLFQGENNPKENGTDSDLATLDMSSGLVWAFPLSEFDELAELRIFVKAWGDYSGNIEWGNNASYYTYDFKEVTCEEELECESGYMIGNKNFSDIGTSQNWGWAHQFNFDSSDYEIREIHHKNGTLEGEVTITYNFETEVISIEEGEGVKITHLYVSNVEPTTTNAPGKFDKDQTFNDDDGVFWVMIKAEVCN